MKKRYGEFRKKKEAERRKICKAMLQKCVSTHKGGTYRRWGIYTRSEENALVFVLP